MLEFVRNIKQKIMYTPASSAIVLFHHLSLTPKIDKSGCKIDTEHFKGILSEEYNYIRLGELLTTHRKNSIAITFDDGLEDVYTIGYKYLKDRKIPFTVFVITDMLDTEGYITTQQLKKMSEDELVTIGAHGTTHCILTEMTTDEKKQEVVKSKQILEKLTGRDIDIFAYSHGQYDKECMKIVRDAGYTFAVSVEGYPFNIFTYNRLFRIPRMNIDTESEETAVSFLKRILY